MTTEQPSHSSSHPPSSSFQRRGDGTESGSGQGVAPEVRRLLDDVRLQLSCDLHDYLLQPIVAGRMLLGTLHRKGLDRPESELREELNAIGEQLKDSLRIGRSMIAELRGDQPSEPIDLVLAIVRCVDDFRQRSEEIQFRFEPAIEDASLVRPANEVRMMVGIVSEAIRNAVRHASAKNVTIDLSVDLPQRQIHAGVTDDGCGFDVSSKQRASQGIPGIQLRADLIDGKVKIQSNDEGTQIRLTVPLT